MPQKRKQYVKLADGTLEQQMLATSADIVEIEAIAGLTATDVQSALEELKDLANTGGVTSVNNKTGAVTIGKGDVGLGNVDNTSDANKPISTATQTALNAKADKTDLQTVQSSVTTLVGSDNGKSVRTVAAEETAKIVAGANTSYDTLKEIADWIANDQTGAAAMNSQIQTNKTDIATLKTADGQNVKLTGNQTINGTKKFQSTPQLLDGALIASGKKLTFEVSNQNTNKVTLEVDDRSGTCEIIMPNASGTLALDSVATTSRNGLMSSTDKTKLNGIATGATANTGTVTSVTISGGTGISVDNTTAITSSGTRTISLANSGVTAGTYSVVTVDAKGRATAGAQLVEWGTSGQTTPSNLAVGGLFMQLIG